MDTRQADIDYLIGIIDNPFKSQGEKRDAKESLRKISNEGSAVKSMREALVKAKRAGRLEEIKDIHEFIKGKHKYL